MFLDEYDESYRFIDDLYTFLDEWYPFMDELFALMAIEHLFIDGFSWVHHYSSKQGDCVLRCFLLPKTNRWNVWPLKWVRSLSENGAYTKRNTVTILTLGNIGHIFVNINFQIFCTLI